MRKVRARVADAVEVGDEAGLHIQIRFRRQRPVRKILVDDLANELDERRRIVHRRVVRRNAIRRKNAVVHAHLVERADEAAIISLSPSAESEEIALRGVADSPLVDARSVVVKRRFRSIVHRRHIMPSRCNVELQSRSVPVRSSTSYIRFSDYFAVRPAINLPLVAGTVHVTHKYAWVLTPICCPLYPSANREDPCIGDASVACMAGHFQHRTLSDSSARADFSRRGTDTCRCAGAVDWRCTNSVRRGVRCRGRAVLVHVPDADEAIPDVAGGGLDVARTVAPMHLEGRSLLEFRQTHPHERVARRIPLVDFVRIDGRAVLAREPDVGSRGAAGLGVGEAVGAALRELHERLKARKRLRARVARGLQRHLLRFGERRQWRRRRADCRRDKREPPDGGRDGARPSRDCRRERHRLFEYCVFVE